MALSMMIDHGDRTGWLKMNLEQWFSDRLLKKDPETMVLGQIDRKWSRNMVLGKVDQKWS